MAITKPVPVKAATIVSSDLVAFDAGLDERGDYNIAPDAISYGRNGMINSSGNFTKRLSRKKWLPSTVGFNGEVSTVYINGQIYYFVADDGVVKYTQENATEWTVCGGDNAVTTTPGLMTTFLRTNQWLLVMNGVDELRYIDLSNFEMTQFTFVPDPTNAITAVATGITASGPFNVYYAYTYNSDGGGETAISPILTQAVSLSRSIWAADGSQFLTLTFNDTPPPDATSRNLYAAIALQGVTPVASDLAMLQSNIPVSQATLVDNGSLQFNLAFNTAPDTNSTAGIKAATGIMAENVPVLYGDPDNPYNIYFGILTDTGVSFAQSSSTNNSAQVVALLKGTNYYPTSVVAFRNNQNVPNILVLFSGTEGVSKQQTISQKTLTYGNSQVNYWGADDLNTGASAVYSPYGVVNYLSQLIFPAANGITSIKTDPDLQNVLSPSIISEEISVTYATIKNADFSKIVGGAWNNLIAFAVPSQGYDYNNQMLIYDLTNTDKPKWYIWDIKVDWIGTISPPNAASFMYIRQGTDFFKLVQSYVAEDDNADGSSTPYPVTMQSNLKAFSTGKNVYMAVNQAVVYIANFIGTIDIQISYVNNKGRLKTKTKTFTNGNGARNLLGGWGNPRLLWQSFNNRMIGWSTPMPSSGEDNDALKITQRCRIKLPNPVVNEVKVQVSSNLDNTSFDVVNGNFEGVVIGVIGDIV